MPKITQAGCRDMAGPQACPPGLSLRPRNPWSHPVLASPNTLGLWDHGWDGNEAATAAFIRRPYEANRNSTQTAPSIQAPALLDTAVHGLIQSPVKIRETLSGGGSGIQIQKTRLWSTLPPALDSFSAETRHFALEGGDLGCVIACLPPHEREEVCLPPVRP